MGSSMYGAYVGGVDNFINSALRMVEFTDRRNERAQAVADERERARQSLVQKQAARDVYAMGSILKIEPGQSVTPDWLPVLNKSYPQLPDFESVQRTDDGILITGKSEFTLPTGQKSKQIPITEEQLQTMFNQRLSSLDEVGLGMYDKLNKAFGINAISPTQRAAAYSNLIDIKRRSATELDSAGDYEGSQRLWKEIEMIGKQYEELVGIKLQSDDDPKTNVAVEKYNSTYEKYSSGSGTFNLRGLGDSEKTRLDELWALTGQPPSQAPHRSGTPDAAGQPEAQAGQPAAPANAGAAGASPGEKTVKVLGPDGVVYDVPASRVAELLKTVRGSKLVDQQL